jgi:hypothetical protein
MLRREIDFPVLVIDRLRVISGERRPGKYSGREGQKQCGGKIEQAEKDLHFGSVWRVHGPYMPKGKRSHRFSPHPVKWIRSGE